MASLFYDRSRDAQICLATGPVEPFSDLAGCIALIQTARYVVADPKPLSSIVFSCPDPSFLPSLSGDMADAMQMIDCHFYYFRYQWFIIIARVAYASRLAFHTHFAFHGTPRSFRK